MNIFKISNFYYYTIKNINYQSYASTYMKQSIVSIETEICFSITSSHPMLCPLELESVDSNNYTRDGDTHTHTHYSSVNSTKLDLYKY
jgi:hypothetical protein